MVIKILKSILLVLSLAAFLNKAYSQAGNSNIGTEFWTGYMDHINGVAGQFPSTMYLYITCDFSTSVTISSADGAFSQTIAVIPKQTSIFTVPPSAFLGNINGISNKGIHIVSNNPIAIYAHIFANSVSGATLLLPVNTLSNDYFSLNYKQISNTGPAYSVFMVIATDDNTTVQITPTAPLIDGSPKNVPFTVSLSKGQIYQGLSTNDLTGSKIISVANANSLCKKIAVFSGSSKILIGTPNYTSDNLFQQVYPTASWGKTYITVPLKNRNYDIFRIALSDSSANVTLNGTPIAHTKLINGFYYEFASQMPNIISADKPIQVIQYAVTQGNGINGANVPGDVGDPEMIFINPLEQNIDHVTLFSANEFLILNSYINVVIPTVAVPSFTLDGIIQKGFVPVAGNPAYSYAQLDVSTGKSHIINANQGFNAIAYGFGLQESYGYAAGTNVKNLNEYIQFYNPATMVSSATGCVGISVEPQIILPYQTTSITWNLGNGNPPIVQLNPQPKTTINKNGKTLYLYNLGSLMTYQTAGIFAVKVSVFDPTATSCGSTDEVSLNYSVFNRLVAKFSSRDTVCLNDTIKFNDISYGNGTYAKSWHWDFGNGDTSAVQNPVYQFKSPGDYIVSLTAYNQGECSDLFSKTVHIQPMPTAEFNFSSPDCESSIVEFTERSMSSDAKITEWIWNFGDGTPILTTPTNTPIQHLFKNAGVDTVTLQVITSKGCVSSPASHAVVIYPHPSVEFTSPDICLNNAIVQFADSTTIAGTTNTAFDYLWNFGDTSSTSSNPNTSILKNPTHKFTAPGIYHISLSVKSKNGCISTRTKDFTVNGIAKFTAAESACPMDSVLFFDLTNGTAKIATSWYWDFGDGETSTLQNPKHIYKSSGNYSINLTVSSQNGCSTTSFSKPIHINQNPQSAFSYSAQACATQVVIFSDSSISKDGAINKWTWDFGDGGPSIVKINAAPFSHSFSSAGKYIVRLQTETINGCISDIFFRTVVVHPLPVINITMPGICLDDATAQFTNESSIADSATDKLTYFWDFGDDMSNIGLTNLNTSTNKDPSHKYATAKNYTLGITALSQYGCSVHKDTVFVVNGANPIADFTVLNPNGLCSDHEVFLVNHSSVDFGKIIKIDVFFDMNDSTSLRTYYNPVEGQVLRYTYPKFYSGTQNHTIRMIAYSGAVCSSVPKEYTINLLAVSQTAWPVIPPVCQELASFQLNAHQVQGPLGSIGIYYGDGVSQSGIFNPAVAGPGKHLVKFILTAQNGCADTLIQEVTVNPTPTVSAGSDTSILVGAQVKLRAAANGNGLTYKWTSTNGPAIGLMNDTTLNPIASPSRDVTYILTVTTAEGCSNSSTVTVKVLEKPVIPSAFTPNGDGINDTWNIKNLNGYKNCTVEIFNRNGEKVFSSVGYQVPWDGKYKGVNLPWGTYYYIINPKNGRNIISGSVTIIR